MAIQMELSRILISETQDYQLIELREVDGERKFPIVIGIYEAAAIERRLKSLPVKRPQTHELLSGVIEALGGKLEKILIHDLRDHTFYAKLVIHHDSRVVEVDARPSDAIALGVAGRVPIFVEEHVLEEAGSS